jgi:C-terminal of Roc, COR, domain/Ras of Complex, Roc, domain of DAPkinase/Leucine rich repeat
MARDEAYREAERRIEQARREGATKLDLSGLNLTEVPEAIASLTQLITLDLSDNQLSAILGWIVSLTQLRELDLSNNQLTIGPDLNASLKSPQLHFFFQQLPALKALTQLRGLNLSGNQLTSLPESISSLTQLTALDLSDNQLTSLPASITSLTQLTNLDLTDNKLTGLPNEIASLTKLEILVLAFNGLMILPDVITSLTQLRELHLFENQLISLPDKIASLTQLTILDLSLNYLTNIPDGIASLTQLTMLSLMGNPLEPELDAAYEQGFEEVLQFLRARAEGEVTLNEAKLILVGEGAVGKSCLLGALRGDEWVEGRPTTHGIEIKSVTVIASDSGIEIVLNGWDFGGQRVYRPTHQLFFSAPAVYLVVWKPREGSQQGFVKEWITLIKHREPDAKILVVATHGGPGQRQPDIDRQELIDLFGNETVVGFFSVDSKPNPETQSCKEIEQLRAAIANTAAALPEMGGSVPTKWQRAREALQASDKPYLPYDDVINLCAERSIDQPQAELFIQISHRLGHLTHYHYDTALRNIVILKPDWLAKAISFVLDDETTRRRNGLVEFDHLSQVWSHPPLTGEEGYPQALHPVFLRLMEQFDLSYKVVLDPAEPSNTSLIAQLVPDNRPEQLPAWDEQPEPGDRQQVQICRIVDDRGQLATAEGLFYQLIVRLHKYSLGRDNYENSIHWQRGLMLDNNYNGRALLEHITTDVKITVRAAYPERFLSYLTEEIKWLVENPKNPFGWKGLRCNVMVPCIKPCGINAPGHGLFEVQKLIESKKKNRNEFPCPISGCDEWQNIDQLLYNAPISQPAAQEILSGQLAKMQAILQGVRQDLWVKDQQDELRYQDLKTLNTEQLAAMSQAEEKFAILMQMLTDEAKGGPRLFSFKPVNPGFFDRPKWMSEKFQITLWCEHSCQPLPALNPAGSKQGVYELELPREWLVKAAPLLKTMSVTLGLILPVAGSVTKLMLDDKTYKGIEEEFDLGQKSLEFALKGSDLAANWQAKTNSPDLEHGEAVRAQGAVLRKLQVLLKEKDPGFGGLIQVQNKRREFLWIHPQFVGEY